MRIEKLTPKQEAYMAEWRDRWTAIGLSTEPANRKEAERGIVIAYGAANLPAPRIVWCDSPLSQGLTRGIVFDLIKSQKVGASVRASVEVGASVRASVKASVGNSVRASVGASVRDSVEASVRDSVWNSVGNSVKASVGNSVRDSVGASVRDSVGASVRASVKASVGNSVWDSVRASVGDSVGASVGNSVRASVGDSGYGQHDASWIAFYSFFRVVCRLEEQTEKLEGLRILTENAGWYLPHAKICWVSERHNICNRDDRGRLHCESGPALQYPDKWGIYAWHGVRVNYRVIKHPQDLTVKEIQEEQNVEVRRVMMERYGLPRFLLDSGAKLLHEDETGKLYRTEVPNDEPLVMVQVLNSTPEPDGERKTYSLRVPPGMTVARQAVAWTFSLSADEYAERLVAQT